jgi:hypothetical protein
LAEACRVHRAVPLSEAAGIISRTVQNGRLAAEDDLLLMAVEVPA